MNIFSNILYLTNFIKYCFLIIYSFFLYLNFNTSQTFFILILFIKYSWSSVFMQIISQYKIFISVFWFLKLRLLKRNESKNSLINILIAKTSTTFYRSSSISYLFIRINHWLQFLQVRIEMNCCFIKKLLKFMMTIVDMYYKKWIK